MEHWAEYELGELLERIIGGGTPSKRNPNYWDGEIPWASVKDMKDGVFSLSETIDHITEEGLQNSSTNLIPAGTVITSTRMGLGRCFINKVDMAINQDLKALVPTEKLDNDYLLWLMASKAEEIQALGTGTTVKGIRLEELRALKIRLPELHLQKEIAGTLNAYNDLIENNNRRIQILETIAQKLYQEWFVHYRFPNHDQSQWQETEQGKIPAGWEVKYFTEIADVLGGGTPSTKNPEYWGGEIKFFAPKDAPDSFYVLDTDRKTTLKGIEKSSTKLYPKDTIFITARGTVGKIVLPAEDMAMNQSCYALRMKNGENQRFLFLLVKEQVAYLKKNTGGATFDTIVTDTFRSMLITVPPMKIIRQFEEYINPLFDNILCLLQKNKNLKQQRDLLLQKLIDC